MLTTDLRTVENKLKNAGLTDELAQTVARIGAAALRSEAEIVIKGGVAAAIHVRLALDANGDKSKFARPLSLDVDWTCSKANEPKQLALLASLSLRKNIEFKEPIEQLGQSSYGSRMAKGELLTREGAAVSLDCIPLGRFDPGNRGFYFEFGSIPEPTLAGKNIFGSRAVTLNAVEAVVCEKLALGRGPESGKFDLIDAAALLSLFPIRREIVSSVIANQAARPGLDNPPSIEQLRSHVEANCASTISHTAKLVEFSKSDALVGNPDLQKQLLLASRLIESSSRISAEFLIPYLPSESVTKDLKTQVRDLQKCIVNFF